MAAFLVALVAAALAEFGDKTQLLVIALAMRFRRPLPVLAGVAAGALGSALIAGLLGMLVHGLIMPRAASLLVALALAFAGIAGLLRQQEDEPDVAQAGTGAFFASAAAFFAVELGDKTQFLTFAFAAQYDSVALVVAGAVAGVVAANAPAALLGAELRAAVPLKAVRIGSAIVFLMAAAIVAVNALRLV